MKKSLVSENYLYNKSQIINPNVYQDNGLIVNQGMLENLRFGKYTAKYCGCGWISLFNALTILGKRTQPEDIMSWVERRPFFRGMVFSGKLGVYPWAAAKYLRSKGFKVKSRINSLGYKRVSSWADASIIYYLNLKRGHFVAFEPTGMYLSGDPLFHFYNDIYSKTDDIRTMKQFKKDNKILFSIIIGAKKSL